MQAALEDAMRVERHGDYLLALPERYFDSLARPDDPEWVCAKRAFLMYEYSAHKPDMVKPRCSVWLW